MHHKYIFKHDPLLPTGSVPDILFHPQHMGSDDIIVWSNPTWKLPWSLSVLNAPVCVCVCVRTCVCACTCIWACCEHAAFCLSVKCLPPTRQTTDTLKVPRHELFSLSWAELAHYVHSTKALLSVFTKFIALRPYVGCPPTFPRVGENLLWWWHFTSLCYKIYFTKTDMIIYVLNRSVGSFSNI
jgi:hypothetical protein